MLRARVKPSTLGSETTPTIGIDLVAMSFAARTTVVDMAKMTSYGASALRREGLGGLPILEIEVGALPVVDMVVRADVVTMIGQAVDQPRRCTASLRPRQPRHGLASLVTDQPQPPNSLDLAMMPSSCTRCFTGSPDPPGSVPPVVPLIPWHCAAFKFTTNWGSTGSIGKSPGFAPLMILSMYQATRAPAW